MCLVEAGNRGLPGRREGGVALEEWLDPLASVGVAQALEIGFVGRQPGFVDVVGMFRPSFPQDDFKGIFDWPEGRIGELFVFPGCEAGCALLGDRGIFFREIVGFVRVLRKVKKHLVIEVRVEPIVIGADVEPMVPSHGSLTDMGTLAEDQLIAAGVFSLRG